MKKKDQLFKEVESAFKKVAGNEDPLPPFVDEVRSIIDGRVSDPFYKRQDFDHDIGYLHDTYKTYDFKDHQFVLLVTNYIKKGMKIDAKSKQGPDGKKTYMRLIQK